MMEQLFHHILIIMKINKDCNFIQTNLYSYDFEKCAYNILKYSGYDVSHIDPADKLNRNIQIGYMQRDNIKVNRFIQNNIYNLVNYYLKINKINKEHLIIHNKDGFIVNKKLPMTNLTGKLRFEGLISKLIISTNRSKYLMVDEDGKVIVKGMRKNIVDDSFYKLFRDINLYNKRTMIENVEKIRHVIMDTDKVEWFCIKSNDPHMYEIPLLTGDVLTIHKRSVKLIDPEEINRYEIWKNFIWPFVEPILIQANQFGKFAIHYIY